MFVRVLLTAILATSLASAQRGGGGGGEGGEMGGMGGMGGGMPRVQRQSKFDIFAERLKLNKDQKDEVQTLLTDATKEAVPVRDQLMRGREAIVNAMIGGKNPDEIKKLLDMYATAAAQMASVEAKAFGKVYAMLKPNQQSKAASAFELLVGLLDAPGGGGGRGAGGRRGRG